MNTIEVKKDSLNVKVGDKQIVATGYVVWLLIICITIITCMYLNLKFGIVKKIKARRKNKK